MAPVHVIIHLNDRVLLISEYYAFPSHDKQLKGDGSPFITFCKTGIARDEAFLHGDCSLVISLRNRNPASLLSSVINNFVLLRHHELENRALLTQYHNAVAATFVEFDKNDGWSMRKQGNAIHCSKAWQVQWCSNASEQCSFFPRCSPDICTPKK